MTDAAKSGGAGCIIWMVLAILVVAPLGTCAVVGFVNLRHPSKARVPTAVEAPLPAGQLDPRVKSDAERICGAYRELAKTLSEDAFEDPAPLWKKLGAASAPSDPWGRPYEWQPWDRSVRSYGPDKSRGTSDDMIVHCEG